MASRRRQNALRLAASVLVAGSTVSAGANSLKDIKHIVLFMQENRSFDHYFGTMAGVRGFADPNVQINSDGLSTFQQPISTPENGTDILTPWRATYLSGTWPAASQCMVGGGNGWDSLHYAYAGGLGNNWTAADGPWSMAYFAQEEIPTQFDIAQGWTVLDMNVQSVLAPTDPNRIWWNSGTINAPGSPSNRHGEGSVIINNNAEPGCEAEHLNCFPFTWKTFQEYLEEASITWQVWQDMDNFEDNMLAYFSQYQTAAEDSPLRTRGNSYPGLDAFYKAAEEGKLPQVSWIIGPSELAEHPPNRPVDGAWLQKKVVDAVTGSPAYNETVLIISYDEQGGWADHVVPKVAPEGTPGEWMKDPYGEFDDIPIGPGPRVPRYIISPYTRGGHVFAEYSDHSSDIMFVEEWAAANGYKGVRSEELSQWRRDTMSNLVNALDFENPDYTLPSITAVDHPETKPDTPDNYSGNLTLGSLTGPWVGPARCLADYGSPRPAIPYGATNAAQDLSLVVEDGFKPVRGQITEGRYLTFEMNDAALTNMGDGVVGSTSATEEHEDVRQRWVVESSNMIGGEENTGTAEKFRIKSALDGGYIAKGDEDGLVGKLTYVSDEIGEFTFSYTANGAKYGIRAADGNGAVRIKKAMGCGGQGDVSGKGYQKGRCVFLEANSASDWKIFSVTYK